MQNGIHPEYGPVAFRDRATGDVFLTRSTRAGRIDGDRTVEMDGRTYPVLDVDVSVASHPFWTGRGRVLDAEGRVERFQRRYGTAGAGAEGGR